MNRLVPFAALLYVMACGDSAAADLREPTDVELKASYCIAMLQEQLREIDTTFPAQNEDVRELKNKNIHASNRLRAYIVPRVPYVDPAGLMAARAQAVRDLKESNRVSSEAIEKTTDCVMKECS